MVRRSLIALLACASTSAAAGPSTSGQVPATGTLAKNDPRGFMGMGRATPCPVIAKAAHDPKPLAASGATAGLLLDLDGFVRPEMGVEEAVALFGKPVMCDGRGDKFGFLDLHLLPTSQAAHAIELETRDGQLIGMVVEYDPPVPIDMTALRAKYGTPGSVPAPDDSFEPSGMSFPIKTADFTGITMFRHRESSDPETAWKISELIIRRSAVADDLPEGFTTAADVDRLIKLTLRPHAPDAVDYFGTIGVFDKKTGDHISFRPGLAKRNVKTASMEKRTVGERDFVHAVTIKFTRPIAIGAPAAIPGVTRTLVKGKLAAITIVRPEP